VRLRYNATISLQQSERGCDVGERPLHQLALPQLAEEGRFVVHFTGS
jgi:hypothetical protein